MITTWFGSSIPAQRCTAVLIAGSLSLSLALVGRPAPARAGSAKLFISSGKEHPDGTVTLPLHKGKSRGRTVWYVLLDASSGDFASAHGVNVSMKLAGLRNTAAIQKVRERGGVVRFPGTVDFKPVRRVVPGSDGFPPKVAAPGAVGEPRYSPFIQLPGGTLVNAPQVANATGRADKVVSINFKRRTVVLQETNGFARNEAVRYVSTDASNPVAAALEGATFAPRLNRAPRVGGDGTDQARTSLAAFVNGQTGARNRQRQGLNSAILDGADPLNVLRWLPQQGRYSPLWDVHLAAWTAEAKAAGRDVRQESFDDVATLAEEGWVTAPGGGRFGASGFIVNCPIVSSAG